MPVINDQFQTLLDLAQQSNMKGEIQTIIELLSEVNPIIGDAPAMECNQGTTHLTTMRTGLPQVTWRKLYQGVQPSKSTKVQVKDTTGMLEAWTEVDAKLLMLAKDKQKFMLNESKSFLEAMSQEMATGFFYHDTATDPEKFMGLAPRFNSLAAENGSQIIDAGGTGSDNLSVWFITFGENLTSLLFPEGTQAGLQRDFKGIQTKENNDGSLYDVAREKFEWDIGLTVQDWRYIARVANVDVNDLRAGTVDIEDFMIDAYYQLQGRLSGQNTGRTFIYCNTRVKTALHKRAKDQANVNLVIENFEGREIIKFLGIPIRETEALVSTEERVV